MPRIKQFPNVLSQNLTTFQAFITDTDINSQYFRISEFKDTFTGGKNGFLIEGSEHLKETTEIKIEILDVTGNPVYYEPGDGIPEYYEGISKVVSVHAYEDTPIGQAKITILGELKTYIDDLGVVRDIPDEWRGIYNVKWERTFKLNKLLPNEDKVRFYRRPTVNIDEIVKPLLNNIVTPVTNTGTIQGTPLVPTENSKLAEFSLPTSYLLRITDGGAWTGSIVGNRIEFPNLNYSPKAIDVVNKTDLIVDIPYTENNNVLPLPPDTNYEVTFNFLEGVSNLETALTGSFAKINIDNLSTFVGDVARVKIYRKSESDLSDFQFIQEIQLESTELLVDLDSEISPISFYGLFSPLNIETYWVTSSNNITTEFNQDVLFNSVKLNSEGVNQFFTSKSIDVDAETECTLGFNVKVSGSVVDKNSFINVYLSGSRESTISGTPVTIQVKQEIVNLTSNNNLLQKTEISQNIIADELDNPRLYFDVSGSWYISDVSFRTSEESAFSPDSIRFIQPIPRNLPSETFNFLFEFYDINNNYIPVLVESTKTFDGGNLNQIRKRLELIPSSLYFQFDSGSGFGNPVPPTVISIDVVKEFLTGSVTFTSRSFDFFNNELSASDYSSGQYPGLLEDIELDTVRLTVENFTGSRDDIPVQYIQFTAECDGVTDSIIITRIVDGKGGVNFEITPYTSTIIRNSSDEEIEIQAVRIDGINQILLKDGLEDNRSDFKLFVESGSDYITLEEANSIGFISGLTPGLTGSGELNYNARFNRDSIDEQLTVYLIPSSSQNRSGSIVANITLVDLLDGLNSGFVEYDTDVFTINPVTQTEFTPVSSSVTASFYLRGKTDNPISASVKVFPSMSINPDFVPEYFMYYVTESVDDDITVLVKDVNGNIIDSLFPSDIIYTNQSKQLNVEFEYIEQNTSASVIVDKVFTIVPEGIKGDDPIVIEISPLNVVLHSNDRGIVDSYLPSKTEIKVKQGFKNLLFTGSKEPGTFHISQDNVIAENITPGAIVFNNDITSSLLVSSSLDLIDLSGSIEYPLEIRPFLTSSFFTQSVVQNYTKVLDGPRSIQIDFNPQNPVIEADENANIIDFSQATTRITVREGGDQLTFDPTGVLTTPGSWRIQDVFTESIQIESTTEDADTAVITFNEFNPPSTFASASFDILVFPLSLDAGHQFTSSLFTREQRFTKNVGAVDARSVKLTSTATQVIYDADGEIISPTGDISLVAIVQNTTGSAHFQFLKNGNPISPIQTNNEFLVSADNFPLIGESDTFTVTLRDGNSSPSANIVATDFLNISSVGFGEEAITAFLSNPSATVVQKISGETVFTLTGTDITAAKGSGTLQAVTTFTGPSFNEAGDIIPFSLGEYRTTINSVSGHLTLGGGLVSGSIVPISSGIFVSPDIVGWDNPIANPKASIEYKVDIEDGRRVLFLTQNFSVTFEGATGPGIVFRGEWDAGTDYIYEEDNRRDAVLFDKNGDGTPEMYYATLQSSGPSTVVVAPSGSNYESIEEGSGSITVTGTTVSGDTTFFVTQVVTGDYLYTSDYTLIGEIDNINDDSLLQLITSTGDLPAGTTYLISPELLPFEGNPIDYWQELGEEDFFVAAKIAIFEESFVKNTINVGNNPGSAFANIVIAGGRTDPFIAIGQSGTSGTGGTSGAPVLGYDLPGIFLGMFEDGTNGTTGRLSIKTTSTSGKGMTWDGDNLTIVGGIRQISPGEPEGRVLGIWNNITDGFSIFVRDIVTHNGRTWVANESHNKDLSDEPGVSSKWEIAADAGTSGTAGADGTSGTAGQDGLPGPGIVYRGEWNSGSIEYFSTDDRRDVVFFDVPSNDSYWIAKQTHISDSSNEPPNADFWEPFGATFTSIATSFILTEDAVATRSISVGENAAIAIVGTGNNPFISIGQPSGSRGFNQTGIFAGITGGSSTSGGTGRLSLKSATDSMLWNGTSLSISGSNSTLVISSDNGSTIIQGGRLTTVNGEFTGKIESEEGSLGGWVITDGQLKSDNSSIVLQSSGSDGEYIHLFDSTNIKRLDINSNTELVNPTEPGESITPSFTASLDSESVTVANISSEGVQSGTGVAIFQSPNFQTNNTGKYDINVSHGTITATGDVISLEANADNGSDNRYSATADVSISLRIVRVSDDVVIQTIGGSNFFETVTSFGDFGGGLATRNVTSFPSNTFVGSFEAEASTDYRVELVISSILTVEGQGSGTATATVTIKTLSPPNSITISNTNTFTEINGGGFQSVIDENRWLRISDKNPDLSSGNEVNVPGSHLRGGLSTDMLFQSTQAIPNTTEGIGTSITFTNISNNTPSFSLIKAFGVFNSRDSAGVTGTQSTANINSIQRLGIAGIYRVTFQNPMTNTNYGVIATVSTQNNTSTTDGVVTGNNNRSASVISKGTNSFDIAIRTGENDTRTDSFQFCTVMVIG
jgi:hypothetical protein